MQTNGLTLCRTLADRLPQGYLTPMDDGRSYGEALLDPSVIYANVLAALWESGVHPHYAAHVTGHGWRKLMRLDSPFVYRIHTVREPPPIFRFIQRHGPVDDREAYGTFNMGVGFALFVGAEAVDACLAAARRTNHDAWLAGEVQSDTGRKAVEIVPLGLCYEAQTLQLR